MRKTLPLALAILLLTSALHAGNQVMGEIEFKGKTKVERDSGVWVDGGYVGYLKELKGSKRVLLLPGEHVITVRQNGYQDFEQRIQVRPGEKQVVRVEMTKAATGAFPAVPSTVKLAVNPSRAAVFLDGRFVGHVAEFEGLGRGLLVAPGAHTIQVSLPGYQTFETQINPLPRQKVEVKTDLLKDNGMQPMPSNSSRPMDQQAPVPPSARTVPQRSDTANPPPGRTTPQQSDTSIPPPDRTVPPPPRSR